MHELIVIGAGPAGLSACVYAARKKLDTLLVSKDIGGQMNWTLGIENYLGFQLIEGPELISKFQTQISQFPVEQNIGASVDRLSVIDGGFEAVTDDGKTYQSKAVLLTTGKKPRRLNIPGEDRFIGRGVTYCAICDGPVFADQEVVVVGGGNSAVEAVLDMAKIASRVHLVSNTPLTADAILVQQLREIKNITQHIEHETTEIFGEGLVDGVEIRNLKNGSKKRLEVTGVLVEIGLIPNSDLVKDMVNLNKQGEVPVSCFCETTLRGLYAAGDVTDVPEKQIIVAAGEGAKAALRAHRYLQHKGEEPG